MQRADLLDELLGVIRRIVKWIEWWRAASHNPRGVDGAGALRTSTNMVFVGVPRTLEAGLCRWIQVMAVLCSRAHSPSICWAPPPSPAPVTTIAWRMAHLIVSVLGTRVAGQFGGPTVSNEDSRYAGTAAEALAQLDGVYAQWIAGGRGLDTVGLSRACGPSEVQDGNPADLPLVSLVLHISREVIHHGAEIALLRDLYTPGHSCPAN